jgi:hypothetical protein
MDMSPRNPARVPDPGEEILKGHDVRSLGPSDSSDTGADMMGLGGLDGTTDRQGTGERSSVDPALPGEHIDLSPNRIVRAEEAGLGGGLDQAEEAQLGITDEELEQESGDIGE